MTPLLRSRGGTGPSHRSPLLSTRVRATVLATLIAMVLLVPMGWIGGMVAHLSAVEAVWQWWRSPQRLREDVRLCGRSAGRCLEISVVRAWPSPASPVVHVGGHTTGVASGGTPGVLFGVEAAGLVLLSAYAIWRITGRTLRPVNMIRAELAAITSTI